ncbi:TPA: NUDIX hydrolase [Candidatus Gastranaerophilales bacterium HUM_20]|nr:nUDIX hydrolase [Clostridium sp. CAG:729]DAB24247.1 MAG TPA: NUDIX hydrolase [Candidatus Gastranaerophilales bacterium HUM_20]
MEFKEKTLDSQMMYDGRIIKVYKDNVELADGKKSFREVVRHSGGVVILAIKDYDKILLVKQYRYPIGETVLELPAGKLEKGEDPFEAAKRELEEETGYCANKWTDLGYINTSPGFSDEKLYLYLAQDLEYTHCHPDEGEIIQAFEYKYDDVLKMIDNGEINDAKTICGLMRANMKRII